MFFEDCETCKDNNNYESRKDDNNCEDFNCREEVPKSRT